MTPDSTQFVQIQIGNSDYRNVHDFNFEFTQAIDKENQPCGIPRGGKLCVKVSADKTKANPELLNWMIKREQKDGHILIHKPGTDGEKLTKIEFKNAFCVNYKQTMVDNVYEKGKLDTSSLQTYIEDIQITWEKLIWDAVEYNNEWK